MCVIIKIYNVCEMQKESHPSSRHTNYLSLHGLRQILYLNHQNIMCQMRHFSLHVCKDSLYFSSCLLIPLVPLTMLGKLVRPLCTYVYVIQVSS
jgi:hypothetical protein